MTTTNYLKTALLLGALTGLIVICGQLLGGSTGAVVALGLAAVLNLGSYWYSDKIVLARYRAKPVTPTEAPRLHAIVDGLVARAGMPKPKLYLLPQRMDRRFYIGTMVVFFWVVNWIKVIPYAYLGQLSETNLETSLVLAPLAPLSIFAAVKLVDVLNNDTFYRLTYLILFLISLKLIWDGATSFAG